MAFFAIINPMTTRRDPALRAVVLAFVLVAVFTVSGREIFSLIKVIN